MLSFLLGKEALLPRQLLTFLLGKKQSNSGRHSPSLKGSEQFISGRQSGRCSPSCWGRKHFFPGNCSPSYWEGSSLTPEGTHLPSREVSSSSQAGSQAGALLPTGKGSNLAQSGSQAGALLPLGEGSSSSPVTAHLPPGEEGSSISQAIAHLPTGEGSNSPLGTAHLPPEEAGSSPQAIAHLPSGEGRGNPQAGLISNHTRSGKQGFRCSNRHRAPQASQDNSTASQVDSANSQEGNPTPTITNRLPQGSSNEEPNPKWVINLSNKPLTAAQRSVLGKGPNFAVTPGNLLTWSTSLV